MRNMQLCLLLLAVVTLAMCGTVHGQTARALSLLLNAQLPDLMQLERVGTCRDLEGPREAATTLTLYARNQHEVARGGDPEEVVVILIPSKNAEFLVHAKLTRLMRVVKRYFVKEGVGVTMWRPVHASEFEELKGKLLPAGYLERNSGNFECNLPLEETDRFAYLLPRLLLGAAHHL